MQGLAPIVRVAVRVLRRHGHFALLAKSEPDAAVALQRTGMALSVSLAIACVLVAACGGNPAAPTPPPGAPPTISCPVPLTVQSTTGEPVAVTFEQPRVTGGAAPVRLTCTHQSGASFSVGTVEVACTARDAQGRAASCGFTVSVVLPPKLAVTRFLAFGDSITAGSTAACDRGGPHALPLTPEWWEQDVAFLSSHLAEPPYPLALQNLLAQRYVSQAPVVINAGLAGETADDGEDRMPREVSQYAPQGLLLQEGVNDVHMIGEDAPSRVRDDLRRMIQEARGNGVQAIFLGTLLPERDEGCRAFDFVDGSYDIPAVNFEIRKLAAEEGATLVDLFQLFAGQENTLLGEDGLHPTQVGYETIARAFFDAIQLRLEQN